MIEGEIPFEQPVKLCYLDVEGDVKDFLKQYWKWAKKTSEESHGLEQWLGELFQILPYPLTVIYEPYYVDSVYRDEYYRYYSSKHFELSRNCERLTFIHGKYKMTDFLSEKNEIHSEIEQNFIGSVVLKPTGNVGRTLLDPYKLGINAYIRTTRFRESVLGRDYFLSAFPSSGQDIEFMTCAEVNVWQTLEFFGRRYGEYKVVLPSEMLDILQDSREVNILPSDGLSTEQEAYLFMRNGFVPKVYNRFCMLEGKPPIPEDKPKVQEERLIELEDRLSALEGKLTVWVERAYDDMAFAAIMHFYVESGIPVLVNLRDKYDPTGDNHSVTCIGHERREMQAEDFSKGEISLDISDEKHYNFTVIPSWCQYDKYVIMEDHSVPYQLKRIEEMSFGNGENVIRWEVDSFVVPLFKHVYMPAEDAYDIFRELLYTTGDQVNQTLDVDSNAAVIRIYLTASRAFKDFRVGNATGIEERLYYSQVTYPEYLWVCEYGTPKSYAGHRIRGEFILDATASKCGTLDSVIAIRHGRNVTYRGPNEKGEFAFSYRKNIALAEEYSMFEHNNLNNKS